MQERALRAGTAATQGSGQRLVSLSPTWDKSLLPTGAAQMPEFLDRAVNTKLKSRVRFTKETFTSPGPRRVRFAPVYSTQLQSRQSDVDENEQVVKLFRRGILGGKKNTESQMEGKVQL